MRHTFQKIVMIIAVCLVASFTGCQKDDSIAPEQSTNHGVKITKITFEEFKKNPKALREFEKVGGKDGLRPKSREYGDGYYYETEEVTLMEYSDSRYTYKSYIFPVYRDVPSQNIENLVIWEKSSGETNSYIFTYYLDESDIESILDGRQIFLGDKTLIRNVAKTDPDPYVVQAADGRCGVYSGTEPNDTNFFAQVYDGVTVYFDVVPCEQYEIDLSYVQDGGNNGGGGDNGGGTGNATPSIIVGYFPSGGSGSGGNPGGPNPGDPGSGGDYNPVLATPVENPLWQGFVNSLSDEELGFLFSEAQLKFELRNLIPQSYPIRLFGEEIFDFAMDGHLDEALSMLEYLNDGTSVTEEEIGIAEHMMESVLDNTAISLKPFFKYPQGSNYATQYPKLTEYLKNKIPQLRFNQFIMDKLEQYSELSVEQIKNDLQYGKGPEIHIAQLNSYGQNVYGIFDHNTPDILYVDVDFVNILENSQPGPQGNALAFLLGVTILHEYVHLGDFVDGNDQPGEEGILFEEATYGESIWIDNAERVLIKWEN